MADIILITEQPMRHTAAGKQDLRNAVAVSGYDELDLLLTCQDDVGVAISVRILTSMQNESEDGWVTAGTFTSINAGGATKMNLANILGYVRYELVTATTTTFEVQGVARRWS